ncbi:hypothetical protein [Sphaerotilus mobilis]|uniref:PilX-like prepilin protein n=1 Tax=Sphaerotilus mobilis TaxID=47994 RepID=A0A4V2EX96_9BURK|nr:hypothetical protein [Sphaerotilus mobilis]RZS58720.1 hypothetical protein EV685_1018 [Sphaerotilus mobilis]
MPHAGPPSAWHAHPTAALPAVQRGAGSLPVLLLILLGLLLYLLHSHQALIAQTRSVARLAQGAAAFEAAEAGLAWTLAQLNRPGDPQGRARDRLLVWPDRDGGASSVLPRHAAAAVACTQDDDTPGGWACHWSVNETQAAAPPEPSASADSPRSRPAWLMQLVPGPLAETLPPHRNTLTLKVTGCSHATSACGMAREEWAEAAVTPDARRHLRLTLALLGDLVLPPDAALSAGAQVSLGPGSRVVQGEPGSGAMAIEAGGNVNLSPDSRVITAPGRHHDDAVRHTQAGLQDPAPRWWRHFRASASLMRRLPSLRHVACPDGGCGAAELAQALVDGNRAVWLDGALRLDGGSWGDAERPLLLVVDGPVRLTGAVQAVGWLLADALDWRSDDPPGLPRGRWQGAISTWGDARLIGPVDLVHRPSVLARMRGGVGTWTALPGSWRDHGP